MRIPSANSPIPPVVNSLLCIGASALRCISQKERAFSAQGLGRLHAIFLHHVGLWRALRTVDEQLYPVVADTSDEHHGILRAIQSGDEPAVTETLESRHDIPREYVAALCTYSDLTDGSRLVN